MRIGLIGGEYRGTRSKSGYLPCLSGDDDISSVTIFEETLFKYVCLSATFCRALILGITGVSLLMLRGDPFLALVSVLSFGDCS